MQNIYVLTQRPEGKRNHLDINEKAMLTWKYSGKMRTGFLSLRTGTCGGTCNHGNESLGSIKDKEFLDKLDD